MHRLSWVCLLAACGHSSLTPLEGGETDLPQPDTPTETIVDSDTVDSDTVDSDTVDTDPEEPAPTWPKACHEIYDPAVLPTFALELSPEAIESLRSDCATGAQNYVPATFTWDGEAAPAQARLKGYGSRSCEKFQFVISFNEEDPDGRFRGLRKIVLDAPFYDRTLLHDRVAFDVFARRGLPYSCVNHARLEVNGDYYGLYANIERIDREYLERHFEEEDGNLYEAGVELKTNEDAPDTRDIEALNAAVEASSLAGVDAVMDLDQAVAEWAVEAMLPALDNFWGGQPYNYFLYHEPNRGFLFLPYDLDLSFADSRWEDGSLIFGDGVAQTDPITGEHFFWRKGPLVRLVLADPGWCARFVEELVAARLAFDPVQLTTAIDTYDAQIRQALDDDRRKPYTLREHDEAIAELRAFVQQRADFVDAWLAAGGTCPGPW